MSKIESDGERLRERFKNVPNMRQFLREHAIPVSPSMLSQNLSDHRPITMEAAIAYAKAFNCTVAEISPRVAAALAAAQGAMLGDLPLAKPSLEASLQVLAESCKAATPATREGALDILALIVKNPVAHASDQIPVLVRKLSGESDSEVADLKPTGTRG